MTSTDTTAEARIVGICKGTTDPLATFLRSGVALLHNEHGYGFKEAFEALIEVYSARDSDEACTAIDEAHEALTMLREFDYDGKHIDRD